MLLYLCPNRDPNIHVRACSRPFIKSNKILTTLVCRQEEFSHPYSLLSAEQREELEDQVCHSFGHPVCVYIMIILLLRSEMCSVFSCLF